MDKQTLRLKQTPQRMAIMKYLQGNKNHPTVEDIYNYVVEQFPNISLATVYKNIDILKNMGLVQEVTIDPDKKHYDPDTRHHHHLICVQCKKIIDVDIDFDIRVPKDYLEDFEITTTHIDFYGICKSCKTKEK
ncbi:MAG: transcriptional repressor [Thermodesulfovibrionales bacterium]|nr:transcriptional repressor [Thermodesulfovibrionales bacterium]